MGLRLQASVAYYLMSDNRRRMPSSAYLRADMTEAGDVTSSRHPGKHACYCCCSAVAAAAMGVALRCRIQVGCLNRAMQVREGMHSSKAQCTQLHNTGHVMVTLRCLLVCQGLWRYALFPRLAWRDRLQ